MEDQEAFDRHTWCRNCQLYEYKAVDGIIFVSPYPNHLNTTPDKMRLWLTIEVNEALWIRCRIGQHITFDQCHSGDIAITQREEPAFDQVASTLALYIKFVKRVTTDAKRRCLGQGIRGDEGTG